MLLDLFIIYQILGIGIFFAAYLTKNEFVWALSAFFAGLLMVTSYSVEYFTFVYNTTISAYMPTTISNSYPYLMALNLLFFALSLVFGIYDIYEKIQGEMPNEKEGVL